MWTTIVQQDLKTQDSSSVVAPENAAAFTAGESDGADMAAQDSRNAWSSNHPINVRLTIPLPYSHYYLTIVGGKERRNPARRKEERCKHPLATTGNIILLGALGLITGLTLFTAIQIAARFVLVPLFWVLALLGLAGAIGGFVLARSLSITKRTGADMAAQDSSNAWSSNHPINVRLTIPLPYSHYYLTIVGGKERRNPARRKEERCKHPLATTGNIILLGALGLITGLTLFTAIQAAAPFVLEPLFWVLALLVGLAGATVGIILARLLTITKRTSGKRS